MTIESRDPQLQALFAAVDAELPAQPFAAELLEQVAHARRKAIARRAVIALMLALVGIPLQDYALAFAELLIVSLIEIENQLAAQVLAPINSVGGLLSITLLVIRAAHKKLFT